MNYIKINLKSVLACSLILTSFQIRAQEISENSSKSQTQEKIEIYQAPHPIDRKPAKYPSRMAQKSREGWVDFNFMVNSSGETYEIEAVDHSYGGDGFISAAMKAVSDYKYKPATLDDEPVDSSNSLRIFFKMKQPVPGVSRAFKRRYTDFTNALENNDSAGAKSELATLAVTKEMSLYDDAYLNLANYSYEKKFGTEENQLIYLKRAAFNKNQQKYFSETLYISLLTNLFILQTNQNYFAEALKTYRWLSNEKNTFDLLTKLESTVDQIEAIRKDDSAYQTKGRISDSIGWTISLYKQSFTFSDVQGEINELKLRCSKKYVFFEYISDKEFHVPKSYGNCYMSVIGTPETSFNLVQF